MSSAGVGGRGEGTHPPEDFTLGLSNEVSDDFYCSFLVTKQKEKRLGSGAVDMPAGRTRVSRLTFLLNLPYLPLSVL